MRFYGCVPLVLVCRQCLCALSVLEKQHLSPCICVWVSPSVFMSQNSIHSMSIHPNLDTVLKNPFQIFFFSKYFVFPNIYQKTDICLISANLIHCLRKQLQVALEHSPSLNQNPKGIFRNAPCSAQPVIEDLIFLWLVGATVRLHQIRPESEEKNYYSFDRSIIIQNMPGVQTPA